MRTSEWREETQRRLDAGTVWRSPFTYTITCMGEEGYLEVPEDGWLEPGDMTGSGGIGMYIFDARPADNLPEGKVGWYGSVQPLFDQDTSPRR